jgi:pyruvate dehydrogenase E2 component (dihydrolipoamide acetyltransferase)
MAEFRMPSLGADMDRGTVLEWRVAPGDTVHRGDIVAVVDTEKSDIEVEIFEDGVIDALVVPVGTEVEVGAVLATLTPLAGAARTRLEEPAVLSPVVRHRAAELGVATAERRGTGPGGTITRADVEQGAPAGRRRASPLARRLARERGIDLSLLTGSGPEGAVVAADLAVAAAPRPRDAQAAIGALMARSKREIPHYYIELHVDLTVAARWLDERNRAVPSAERVLPAAMLLRATALAALDVPGVNGWWRDGTFGAATCGG